MTNSESAHLADRKKKSLASMLIGFAMLFLFALYANLRWNNESPAFEKAKQTADTPAYVRISGEAFLSKDFLANTRPPMFPLILKIYAADVTRVAAFHVAFSIFSWGMLALAVAFSFKGLLRPLAFGLILAISLDRHIAGWDVVILTESLSVSLMALFVALWLWLLRGWSWGKMILLSLVALLWAFTRDTNSWILLMLSGMILLGALFFGARRRYLSIAVVFAFLFVLNNLSAEHGHRWVFPIQNVLAQRILTDQEALAFFEDCGMPVTPELLTLAGGFAGSNDRAFYVDPALKPYRVWLDANGKSCYLRWLLSRPITSLRRPWPNLEWLLVFEDVSFFYPQRYEPLLPWYVERILYPQDAVLWLWGGTTLAALAAIVTRAWRSKSVWLVLIGLSLLIYPHLFIVWHGDVPGTHRHALTISIQFVLSFWFLVLLMTERFLDFIQAKALRERGA